MAKQVDLQPEDECPNCGNGTLEESSGQLVCRGECGAFFQASGYDAFAITRYDLSRLRAIAKRLYSENRLDGNEMRNLAQTIDSVVSVSEQIRIPREK